MGTKAERQPVTVPGLADRWDRLDVARAVVIVTSVGLVLLYGAGSRVLFDLRSTPCTGADCLPFQPSPSNEVSPEFLAYWMRGVEIVFLSVFCALAALLIWKTPRQPLALFTALTMVLCGTAIFPQAMQALIQTDDSLRVPAIAADAAGSIALIGFLFLFPDGRFVPRWSRYFVALWVVGSVIDCFRAPDAPFGSASEEAFPIMLFVVMLGAGSQIIRFRRAADPIERQQQKVVALAMLAAAVGLVVGAGLLPLIPHSVIANRARFALVGASLMFLVLLVIPISIAVALLRYRLWEVDRLARRAILSGALIATVTGIYALIVLGASALVPSGSSRLWPLIAAVAVALVLQPVRGRLERSVNRLFYGQRDDPYAVISSLGERLEGSLSHEGALPTIVETIATAMQLPYVAIALAQEGRFQIAARQGEPGAESIVFPLTSGSETVGELIVSPRSAGEPLSEADRRLLADVARQAGAAVEAVRLTNELEQANHRLRSVRGEERQRLRRDLHDGLGPLLASQMLILDSARTLMPSDPALADDLLAQLHQHIQTAVDDVRRLIDSLRPATLDELGLVPAIQEGAAGLQRGGLRIVIDAPAELGPVPAAIETTAYRIVMEAVTNVVRHARAGECLVTLATEPNRTLRVVVQDDGIGIPDDATAGVGLASMRERSRALGGTFEIASIPASGTTITALLPIGGRTP
jgi:signal transduction histidine kinase